MYLNNDQVYNLIIQNLSLIKPEINELLKKWLIGKDGNALNITPREVNTRFQLLSKVSTVNKLF